MLIISTLPANKYLLPLTIFAGVLLCVSIILFIINHRKARWYKRQLGELKDYYERTLGESQHRVKEETLNSVAGDLHDHVGQLLALVKMNLALQKDPKLDEARDLLSQAINDLRSLVHSLSSDKIAQQDLSLSIRNEVERLRKLSAYTISFVSHGTPYSLQPDIQISLFRIFQECISNIIKHSGARNIDISLHFYPGQLRLLIEDDGRGFDTRNSNHGMGLTNMRARAKILGGNLEFHTSPEAGSSIALTVKV